MSSFGKLSPSGRGLVFGVPAVAAMYYLFWTNLQRSQHNKNTSVVPGAVPTWQVRYDQAHKPVDHADSPATLRTSLYGGGSDTGVETKDGPPTGGNSSGKPQRSYATSAISDVMYPSGQKDKAAEGAGLKEN